MRAQPLGGPGWAGLWEQPGPGSWFNNLIIIINNLIKAALMAKTMWKWHGESCLWLAVSLGAGSVTGPWLRIPQAGVRSATQTFYILLYMIMYYHYFISGYSRDWGVDPLWALPVIKAPSSAPGAGWGRCWRWEPAQNTRSARCLWVPGSVCSLQTEYWDFRHCLKRWRAQLNCWECSEQHHQHFCEFFLCF